MSKAERTKKLIIEKTAPLFNAKGYAGTSLTDMLDVTGLTKGSIYGNFENKDEVALAAFDFNFGVIVNYIRSKMQQKETAIEKLKVYPEIYRNFLKLPFLKEGCPLLNTAIEADDTHPLLKQKALYALKLWRDSIERIIHSGIEKKEIKSWINASEFATILMALIEGAIMQSKITGKSTELVVTMNHLERMIENIKR